jgi:hypothetical protein
MLQIDGISNISFLHNILAHFPTGSEERNKLTNKYLESIDRSTNLSTDLSTDFSTDHSEGKSNSSDNTASDNIAIKILPDYGSEENSGYNIGEFKKPRFFGREFTWREEGLCKEEPCEE